MIRAGTLRDHVRIDRPTKAKGRTGQTVPGWEEVGWDYAEVRDVGGREIELVSQRAPRATVIVRLRWRDDLDTAMSVYDDGSGRRLNIEAITDPDGRRVETKLFCSEAA
tara:strand:+ start:5515 stop:5841 length:327 start_codon:yes stop_codon:yes gene_type:complete